MFNRFLITVGGVAALAGFLFMVKLMHDMTVEMAAMTDHVGRMTEQVTQMNASVQAMGTDVRGMRQTMERMAGIVQRGGQQLEQIEQLSPLEMMRGVMPGQQRP